MSKFENITGLWKRVSTNRVGTDGKPEVYYLGAPPTLKKPGDTMTLTLNYRDSLHLYHTTSKKPSSPKWFLKIKRADGTSSEVEVDVEETAN